MMASCTVWGQKWKPKPCFVLECHLAWDVPG